MRIKGMEGGLSLKNVKVPQRFNQWARETQNRIKIQQQAEWLGKAEEEALLMAEPEPGYGLDGYPLQKGKRYVANGR
jgi:hypothetical protein